MSTLEKILILIDKNCDTEQKFLSDLSFNRTLLSDWKSGKSKSYLKHIGKISEYFNVSTDYLLGNEQKEISSSPLSNEDIEAVDLFTQLNTEEKKFFIQLLKDRLK